MNIIETVIRKSRKKVSKGFNAQSIQVDFPKEGETINAAPYTLRVNAGAGLRNVEVSFNGGSWLACRASSGFWWYDWQGLLPGSCGVLARGEAETGEIIVSPRRTFAVERQAY